MQNKTTTFAEEINQAQHCAMAEDNSMICMGLGINDPKAIFGTTTGLQSKFGSDRVFDMPTSENAMTGVGIGAAITGTRVLMTHQRVDFFLLAMDQLVNNAAKWHYMFNGQMTVPLTIRLIIGRGWGQGPTHQQSLQSWFAHIPGLKVVTPSLTDNVGQLLYQSIMDNNPTIFLEHRWLHNQVTTQGKCLPLLGEPEFTRTVRSGKDYTIISNSFMLSEALQAHSHLLRYGIECEIIEISSPTHINWTHIFASIERTKRCLITEIGHTFSSVASEISHSIYSRYYSLLQCPISIIGLPHYPEPTSYKLTKNYYPNANTLSLKIAEDIGINIAKINLNKHHDIPGEWFKGPF
ncbi:MULTISPECIES: transketolase C-terminal domain-containing protein [unclassified Pseudoalteromonas]|uniref:alpha-ketoacid dehydrogenase subunit beta n=1 Tax=unclassified Pseudoalteromonas TaxID=194690 RepID=UPI000C08C663|nr:MULTISPECIES: transketolase C-terminal domain-containing protein [unclassified Pseudoalteromonas]MDP2635445.1 transketolase C-terminal domain-containing protein [Pseudoalteromonas sp. 1_MG-2023]PHN88816.1 alpha-ketoacid dehydrogenase subunit beta [Pseudoalteromonas sp. 3D05]